MSITPLIQSRNAEGGMRNLSTVSWTPAPTPQRVPGLWMFDPRNPQEPTPEEMEQLIEYLLTFPQVDMPVKHYFAPGVYMREIFFPRDTFVIGHLHKTAHLNVMREGKLQVWMRGSTQLIEAHAVIHSAANVQKVAYVFEDTYWATIHPIEQMPDLDEDGQASPEALRALEDTLIHRSPATIRHELKGAIL